MVRRIISIGLLGLSMNMAHADSAPPHYVSTHPDQAYEQKITQKQASVERFFQQFIRLRSLLEEDRAEVQDDNIADEAHYWVCVRIQQLHTLFQNNTAYQSAFNQHFKDMDFNTMMGYWHSDMQSHREICYQSEKSYSDRP
ncbi:MULTISPECIES: hypothetical protein [Vitreoscilla]|uniref:Secreted protein n=1 Tax=Vitreoscilla stercoraria TaxID=61 RepID=A0ABY4EB17_VITST|nr:MULTISPECIES: hypothetical protein [Vitreoscilla]AUZ05648.1 hypothetical protein ADP71_22600 [Vitreoscilla sp. C1]UOO92941.1 hypothetical protein LVJ81_02560 [Vitreoscilla stercoraria]